MPQKHPFRNRNFNDYCAIHGVDKKKLKKYRSEQKRIREFYEASLVVRDNFRRRVRVDLWTNIALVLGWRKYGDEKRSCLCPNCSRQRAEIARPTKDIEAAKLRAYKIKRDTLSAEEGDK